MCIVWNICHWTLNNQTICKKQYYFLCVFQKPSAGIYILRKNRQKELLVNITCQSSITVEGEMLQRTGSGALVSMKGSPVVGKE